MDQERIGRFIAAMRRERNLTQQRLADCLNVSNRTVSKWECGDGLPELSTILPLCEALQITADELLRAGKKTEEKDRVIHGTGALATERKEDHPSAMTQILYAAAKRTRPKTDTCVKCGAGFNRKAEEDTFNDHYRYVLTYEEWIHEPLCADCAVSEIERTFDESAAEQVLRKRPFPCRSCRGDYPYCISGCGLFRGKK